MIKRLQYLGTAEADVEIEDWIRDNDWFNPTEMYFYFFNFKEANYEVFKFAF